MNREAFTDEVDMALLSTYVPKQASFLQFLWVVSAYKKNIVYIKVV